MARIWSYTGETGPEFWPNLSQEFYEAAQFPLQSPISLSYEETQLLYEEIIFHYERQRFHIKIRMIQYISNLQIKEVLSIFKQTLLSNGHSFSYA
ncbi:hypothetical protein TMUPMC115_1346 [Tetragenococcus muriaticus PMC-11-5]|uniref:Alpha-carbonic anhydrase domain-containing protein n=1 Tax=Tetragenococcus muriaticus PMC-11-5 TaxID=1302649 RepID=A0A091C0Z9_9ENTE|nr:hypothetical protein [Tetragenococcus muriaticus]KFN91516.1 hypothetical protein TMUPMC115_1346 [Tetragenococcus muriaticus PMC-11-5]